MVSETKEILKSDVVTEFENQLRGLKYQTTPEGMKLVQVYEPVFLGKKGESQITTIISILQIYVNDIVKSSNMSEADAKTQCSALHSEMADWFFLNWEDINPKRMTRDQIILGMTSIVYATWKCADKGSFRKDLFGNPIVEPKVNDRPFR